MAMAGIDHRDSTAEIDVTVAFDVPDLGILGACRNDRSTRADAAGDGLGTALDPLLVHAWG